MIPLFKPFIPPWDELGPALKETFDSGYIAQGPKVEEFEKQFALHIHPNNTNYNAVATSSCTAALHLALLISGVKPGDEVISTPMTAEPTNLAILYTGARVVFGDVDPRTGNLDPKAIRDLITDRTRAIMVVHYGGYPADIFELKQAAYWHDLMLIEDCAHAMGARWGERHVGTVGDFGCFSFQATKFMTTVEGGMLVINHPHAHSGWIDSAKRRRWFGIDRSRSRTSVDIDILGYKYNSNEVLATIGLVQLKHIDRVVDKHRENAFWFDTYLDDRVFPVCKLVGSYPSYWFYSIATDRKEHLQKYLKSNGIQCDTGHKRNDDHTLFRRMDAQIYGDGLRKFEENVLHIPCGWWLTESDRDKIAQTIKDGLAK